MRINISRQIIFTIAVIGLLVFLHITKIALPAENIIRGALNPFFSGLYSASNKIQNLYSQRTDNRDLDKVVKDLEARNAQLIQENASLKVLKEENQLLREHFKFSESNDYNFILAEVISRGVLVNFPTQNQYIIINKGAKQGLQIGLPVLSSQGLVVGKIDEVKDNSAKVNLTTDSQCKFAATIQNRDSTVGIAEGDLGLIIKMNFIPQTEEINIGDTVVTSGLEENIPRGLVIGSVTEVLKESNEVWQGAVIEPLVDFNDLIIVSILKP
jgi:rod shape-determining protein MreC